MLIIKMSDKNNIEMIDIINLDIDLNNLINENDILMKEDAVIQFYKIKNDYEYGKLFLIRKKLRLLGIYDLLVFYDDKIYNIDDFACIKITFTDSTKQKYFLYFETIEMLSDEELLLKPHFYIEDNKQSVKWSNWFIIKDKLKLKNNNRNRDKSINTCFNTIFNVCFGFKN